MTFGAVVLRACGLTPGARSDGKWRSMATPMRSAERSSADRAVTVGWYVAAALGFWSFGFTLMRGSDLWWHLAGGRWMVQHGTLWVPDPFSYSAPGQRWINDAWLSDVLLYLWSAAFGVASLAYWKWIVVVATWLLLFRLACRLGADRLAAWAATTFGLAVAAPFLDVRPQLYSFLCWVIVLDATLGRERAPVWLPAVYLLWVNLHASFVLGMLSLPFVLLPSLLDARERTRAVALGAACLGVGFLNPMGADVVLRPLRYFIDPTSPFRTLGEWLPPFQRGGIHSWLYPYGLWAFGFATLAVIADRRRRGDPRCWALIGLGAMTLAMSLASRRFVPTFALGATPVMALALARWVSPLLAWIPSPVAALGAGALAVVWLAPYPLGARAFHYLVADYEFPGETLEFAAVNHLVGNVFNYYNWGGYVQYRSDGRLKVFVDGRSETVYSDDIFRRYLSVLNQVPGWTAVVEQSGADYVLWPVTQADVATQLIGSGGWRSLYRDHVSFLLVRRDVALPDPLVETPESPRRWLKLGIDEMRAGDFASAEGHFERALATEPELQPACMKLVESHLRRGDVDGARAASVRCRSAYPDPARDAVLDRELADAASAD